MSHNLTVVIKSTKLCNMRCTYCYEFEHLADASKIPIDSYWAIFPALRAVEKLTATKIKFCWHGGEPTLLPENYYREAIKIQNEAFGEPRKNLVQTNLMSLSKARHATLQVFDDISISLDVRGRKRVDMRGHDTSDRVIANMDQLRLEGKKFGAINVIHRDNIDDLEDIFTFFNLAGISFRALPYYRETNEEVTVSFGLPMSRIREAMIQLVDLWFSRSRGIQIAPVSDYVRIAQRYLGAARDIYRYDKRSREHVLLIDTNGDVYANGTAYDETFKYGNLFEDSAEQILESHGRNRAIGRAKQLMRVCADCPYFGYCPGYIAAEQTDVELRANDTSDGCPIARPCIDRAVTWIRANFSIDQTARHLLAQGTQ